MNLLTSTIRVLGISASAGLLQATALAAPLASIDFEGGTELANSFRIIVNSTTSGTTPGPVYTQTTNGSANDYLTYVQGSAASALGYGTSATSNTFGVAIGGSLTVSADIYLPTANGSFGFYFLNPTGDGSSSFLALLNVDATINSVATQNEQFRFANDAVPNNTTANFGTLGNQLVADAGVTINTFFRASATYSILSANSYSLTLTAGSQTATATYTNATPLLNVGIGFRTNPTGSSAGRLDNIVVEQVPEPSSLVLGTFSSVGLLALRRRRR